MEAEKDKYMQKLNEALIQLDQVNSSKRMLSDKLVETMKFVRDLERGVLHGDDIESIVSEKIRSEYKREKELNEQTREQIKRCEIERQKLVERIKMLAGGKSITVTTCHGERKDYNVTSCNVSHLLEDLRHFKHNIHQNIHLIERTRAVVLECEEETFATERIASVMFMERDGLHQ